MLLITYYAPIYTQRNTWHIAIMYTDGYRYGLLCIGKVLQIELQ